MRTSGEMRISNFLLWQIANTEIIVTRRLWPDFRGINLLEAVADFQRKEQRRDENCADVTQKERRLRRP
jgi:undecaprenyl diphosphate synthase